MAKKQAGLPYFVMSVCEWIEKTNAIGIIVKKGRYCEIIIGGIKT